MSNSNPRTAKDNFWSKLRVDNNLTVDEVGDIIGVSGSWLSKFCTGQAMPNDEQINALCNYFDVDPVRGKAEFLTAHEIWDADHPRKVKYQGERKKLGEEATLELAKHIVNKNEKKVTVPTGTKAKVMPLIYGKVPVMDFLDYMNSEDTNPLENFYGKVDYSTYNKIAETVKEDDNG